MTAPEKMQALWRALLDTLLDTITHPAEGGIDSSRLAVIRSFLADNGINARTLSEQRAGLERLAELSQGFTDLD
jgi:hypothetical protein